MKTKDKIEKYCKYCEKAGRLSDPNTMLCPHHGVVSAGYVCRRFRYDPMKRTPHILAMPETDAALAASLARDL